MGQVRQRGKVQVDQTRHNLMQEMASRKMAEGATAGIPENWGDGVKTILYYLTRVIHYHVLCDHMII